MTKTTLLLTALLLTTAPLFSQTEKSATPLSPAHPLTRSPAAIRAVVIGISDYQDPAIPDLKYAHRDAEAFAKYLQSPAGGSLPPENIKLLTNEKATMAAVAAELDWLVELSKDGDRAIIYFSGHGDVEAKTARQPGFLLTYDSPPKIYIAGAYPLFYLQLIIETLSNEKNVQTLVITDACRAGKLAGSEIGGTQATAANLAKQYANEIKILSCQPNEFSLEGEQWGGGRGAFSFNLIEGLVGLADKNANGAVNLLEIENYLEAVVPEETAPQSQIPMAVGSKGTNIANVDAAVLAKLKDLKAKQLPTLAAIESKGFEETLLAHADSSVQEKYDAFLTALESKNLLDGSAGQASADALYRELIQEESLAPLHSFMTRRLATVLQDDAQQAINAYLLANPTELEKRWKGDSSYSQYPRYLGRAAELLGAQHYMHNYLLAKKLYFEGLNQRLLTDQGTPNSSYRDAIHKQEEALRLESRAAFLYNELGVLHTRLTSSEKAIDYYQKAIQMAPEWGLPYVNLCLEYFYNNDMKNAVETGDKALELMPDYPQLYNLMGWVNANFGEFWDKRSWKRSGVELKSDFNYDYDNLGTLMQRQSKFAKVIQLLQKAVGLDSSFAAAHGNLGHIYLQVNSLKAAEFHLKKSIQLDSTKAMVYVVMGDVLYALSKFDEAEIAFKKAIELVPQSPYWLNDMGNMYRAWGKIEKALETFRKAMELEPHFVFPYGNSAFIFMNLGNFRKAEWNWLLAVNANPDYPEAYSGLGYYYEKANRFEDAEWMYLKAIELFPDFQEAKDYLFRFYRERGLYKKALEVWATDAPDDPWHLEVLGEISLLTKQYDEAEAWFHKALAIRPNEINLYSTISWFYWMHGDYAKAQRYAEKAFSAMKETDDNFSDLHWHQGWMFLDQGRLPDAIAALENAIKKYPQQERFYEAQFYFNFISGKYREAAAALEKYPQNISDAKAMKEALSHVESKEYAAAISLLESYYQSALSFNIQYFLTWLYTQSGNYEKAMRWFKDLPNSHFSFQLIQQDAGLANLRQTREYQSLMRRRFPEKYEDLDTFEFAEPAVYYPENCVLLANFYQSIGEQDRARRLYEKAISLKTDTLTSEQALRVAEAYLKLGKLEEAEAVCPAEVEPEISEGLLEAGKLFYLLGKTEAATAHFEKYIAGAQNVWAPVKVAMFYAGHAEFEPADKLFQLALEQAPKDSLKRFSIGPSVLDANLVYWQMACMYYFSSKKQQAFEYLESAQLLNPNELVTNGMIALLHYFDQPETAKPYFDAISEYMPLFGATWDCLESMRNNNFEQADACRQNLSKQPYSVLSDMVKYKYLQMKIRQGKTAEALELFEAILRKDAFVNYQLYKTDIALDPIRDTEGFKALMRRYFPEKAMH